MKYDDASWHHGMDAAIDAPADAGATHIALFVAWCMLNGLAGPRHADGLVRLALRAATPVQWFLAACGGRFTQDELSGEGNAFTAAYYEPDGGAYLLDYQATLGDGLASPYQVPDGWHSYDALAPVIGRRFGEWRARTGAAGPRLF